MNSITAGWILFLFAFPAWAGMFVETFDNGNLEGWRELNAFDVKIAPGSWKILDGELEAIVKDEIGPRMPQLLIIGDKTWKDYEIEFDVMPLEKHGSGLFVIAARITKNWGLLCTIGVLSLDHGSNAHCFGGKLPGKRFDPFGMMEKPPLKLKEWSTLKLSVDEANMIFWINGEKALESPSLPRLADGGGVGFGLANYTARFDNITIIGDGIPDRGRLSVVPEAKLATTWGNLKGFWKGY